MQPISFIDPWYFGTIYYIIFLFLCWFTVLYYVGSNQQKILLSSGNPTQGAALLLALILAFFLGLRPESRMFGDMSMYRHTYENVLYSYSPIDFHTEWLWNNIAFFFKQNGFNVHEFFLFVDIVYFGSMLLCAILLMRKNLWIAVLFFFISFSCYSFATNGLRNGFACSIALVAISLLALGGNKRPLAVFLMFLAMGCHRSTALPSLAAITSAFVIKDTKTAIRFWLFSIAISLFMGPIIEQFFAALGFDDRMDKYSSVNTNERSMSQFSSTGFRLDFLLYSAGAVVMVWYVTRKRKFTDSVYAIIANTYLLCNAFWIMVIRSAFSNRFAYLSWFLYPVVIVYPLLRMNLWKDQDRKTALILFFYSGFTFFMFFIYYFGSVNGFRGFNQYWWRD